ncbi:MAG: ABC transporter permease [Flavisolibacter sp.]|nr:ABC transporter permease [Flavisolibacter sp.]
MAQSSKASARRGKPSYVMSIIGVTLVLFLLGIVGWLVINANKLGDYFKENVEVRTFLRGELSAKDSASLIEYIASRPYVNSYEFLTKETAKQKYIDEGNEDWNKVLDYNPLPNSINFRLKKEYVNVDTLEAIKADLEQNMHVTDVQYQRALVTTLDRNIRQVSIGLLIIAILIAVSVIFLIDNTIRLAMFSNRFLIKTMQMVGATRWFIAKPLNIKAVINGAISAVIAIALVYAVILATRNFLPELAALHDTNLMLVLFVALLIIGISISVFSTYRSVLKYLKMKLDDLY